MTIYAALKDLIETQRSIRVAGDPVLFAVENAFLIPPPTEALQGALPCWTNVVRFNAEERMQQAGRWRTYTVNMRLHVALAGEHDDEAAWLALAALEACHTAFGSQNDLGHGGVTLGGNCTTSRFRGTGSDTLVLFQGVGTIGLDLLLDIEIKDAGPPPAGFS